MTAAQQATARAVLDTAVKMNQCSPEQIAALCELLETDKEPSVYILALWRKADLQTLEAAIQAVNKITDNKTIDELRAIRCRRQEEEP